MDLSSPCTMTMLSIILTMAIFDKEILSLHVNNKLSLQSFDARLSVGRCASLGHLVVSLHAWEAWRISLQRRIYFFVNHSPSQVDVNGPAIHLVVRGIEL